MTHILRLIEDHEMLDASACTLSILADAPSPMPEAAFDQLQQFRHALTAHLAEEAVFLKDARKVGNGEFASHSAAHSHDFADLVSEWETYLSEWSEDTIGEDWIAFGGATRWMMRRLREQISAENAVL
jgi:hypothetical protein